jgi:hypothetical protein
LRRSGWCQWDFIVFVVGFAFGFPLGEREEFQKLRLAKKESESFLPGLFFYLLKLNFFWFVIWRKIIGRKFFGWREIPHKTGFLHMI